MKKVKMGLLAVALGLFVLSCNSDTESETITSDSTNTQTMDAGNGGMGTMDTNALEPTLQMDTATATPADNTGGGMPEGDRH